MEVLTVPSSGGPLPGPNPSAASPASELDAAIDFPAIVHGSLPPGGRDLDLLVLDHDLERLQAALRRLGYRHRLGRWVRSRECDLDVVEPVTVSQWTLPGGESEQLFGGSLPIGSLQRLRRPAPQHALLIAARRVPAGAEPESKLRRRALAALQEDPAAGGRARAVAPSWGAAAELERLLEGDRLARSARMQRTGRVERMRRRARADGPTAAVTVALGKVAPWRRPGVLVAVSGLDGAGKSTQVENLERVLWRLGRTTRTLWVPLRPPTPVNSVARLIKGVLGRLTATAASEPLEESAGMSRVDRDERLADFREPARAVRRRSALISTAWALTLVIAVGLQTGLRVRRMLWRGEDVVCDRYLLDAWVYMNYRYEAAVLLRPIWRLLGVLLPRADMAVLLEVPAATAASRKSDFTLAQNERRADLYATGARMVGSAVVDGNMPRDAICRELSELLLSRLEPGASRH